MDRVRMLRTVVLLLFLGGASGFAVADELEGRSERAWLGVWLSDAVDGGAQINSVVDRGPAHEAGIRAGDVVIEASGRPVGDEDDLGRVLRGMAPGDRLEVKLLREGQPLELSVALRAGRQRWVGVAAPPAPPDVSVPPMAMLGDAGLTVSEITPALREHFGAPATAGILVTRVESDRTAAEAGLAVGDVLVRVGKADIRTEHDLRVNLVRWNRRDPLIVEVVRGREPTKLTVLPSEVTTVPRRFTSHQVQVRRIETEIERLERRLEELKRELVRVREQD